MSHIYRTCAIDNDDGIIAFGSYVFDELVTLSVDLSMGTGLNELEGRL